MWIYTARPAETMHHCTRDEWQSLSGRGGFYDIVPLDVKESISPSGRKPAPLFPTLLPIRLTHQILGTPCETKTHNGSHLAAVCIPILHTRLFPTAQDVMTKLIKSINLCSINIQVMSCVILQKKRRRKNCSALCFLKGPITNTQTEIIERTGVTGTINARHGAQGKEKSSYNVLFHTSLWIGPRMKKRRGIELQNSASRGQCKLLEKKTNIQLGVLAWYPYDTTLTQKKANTYFLSIHWWITDRLTIGCLLSRGTVQIKSSRPEDTCSSAGSPHLWFGFHQLLSDDSFVWYVIIPLAESGSETQSIALVLAPRAAHQTTSYLSAMFRFQTSPQTLWSSTPSGCVAESLIPIRTLLIPGAAMVELTP